MNVRSEEELFDSLVDLWMGFCGDCSLGNQEKHGEIDIMISNMSL